MRHSELPTKLCGIHLGQCGRLEQRLTLGRDAPNATVFFIAVWMAQRGLIMADDGVEPVGDVQRAIGAGVEIHGAEGVMRGGEYGR